MKFCSIYIHLCLWKNILIGQSCWLSCCEVWYSSNLEILPFLFKVLGKYVLMKMLQNHSITYSSHGEQFLLRSNITSRKFQAFHTCCLLLYWVRSSLIDPCWEIYHAPKIKITHTHIYMCSYTGSMQKHASIHQKNSAPTLGVEKMIVRQILHVLNR
jgi:hypothetical protein